MDLALQSAQPFSDLGDAWTGLEIAGETFAIRYDVVTRVLAAGAVTALPFAPAGVEGVASIAGGVLPVISLRALLFPGQSAAPGHGRELVVLDIAGQRFAVRVDNVPFIAVRLASRMATNRDSVVTASEGVAEWHGRTVICLSAQRLGLERLLPSLPPSGAPGMVGDGRSAAASIAAAPGETVLAVTAGGIPCGLPASSVAELLAALTMTRLPLVPPVVLGVAMLRRTPLLVLSLARLLGGSEAGAIGGYVVVTVGASRLALAVGDIGGLRRAETTLRILDPARMIDGDFLAPARPQGGAAAARPVKSGRGGRFLSLSIGDRFCALPLADVDRIYPPRPAIRLPAGVTPGIDGAVEVGGRILPLTEGRRWLSLPLGDRPPGAHVVLRHDSERRVLAVDAVHRVVTIAEQDILTTGAGGQPVAALGRVGDRSIVILSAARMMAAEHAA